MPAGGINELSALIDPAWIEQALAATGRASIRRRKLSADHAVWLVIGLALFRQMPMWQVVQEMTLTLDGQDLPVPSSTVHLARAGTLPKHLQLLLDQARYFVLPPRRPDRCFPREVKRSSRSKYPSKNQSGLN